MNNKETFEDWTRRMIETLIGRYDTTINKLAATIKELEKRVTLLESVDDNICDNICDRCTRDREDCYGCNNFDKFDSE